MHSPDLKICFMCHMQVLELSDNKISDAGSLPLQGGVESGALASGATILLGGNSVTETGKQVMCNTAEAHGLDVSCRTYVNLM